MKIRTLLVTAIAALLILVLMTQTASAGLFDNLLQADTAPPVSADNGVYSLYPKYNGWYKGEAVVGITAYDQIVAWHETSGVRNVYYSYDGSSFSPIRYNIISVGVQVRNDGITTVYFYADDEAGNVEPTVHQKVVKIDTTAPQTTASVSPEINGNGWAKSNVVVTLTANDAGAGVKHIRYKVDGGDWNKVGGNSASFSVNGNGEHIVKYYAEDELGWEEAKQTLMVNIDKVKPTIEVSPEPVTGWYTTSPAFTFTFNDDRSGIYDHSPATITQGDTSSTQIVSWATDKAGNRKEMKFTVKVDTAKPSTTLASSRAANGNNWYNAPVDVSFTATDAISGVDHTSYELVVNGVAGSLQTYTPGTSVNIGSEGTTVVKYYSVDKAGNTEAENSYTIQIDTIRPTIAVSPMPSASWYSTNPTFHFTFGDSLSGIQTTSAADVTVSADTTGQEVIATATDRAGNSEELKFTVKVDTTMPSITGAVDRSANPEGWYNAPVTVNFTATDATSDIASVIPASVTLDREGAAQSASGTATDNAGNSAGTTVGGINIDLTAPAVTGTLSGERSSFGWFNGDASLSLSYGDATSGIGSVMYSLDGSQWNVYTGAVTVPKGGSHNVYYGAIDKAGNRKNGSEFAYFPPASYMYVWGLISPTATPTATPTVTPTPGVNATPTATPAATAEATATPTVTPTPEATTTVQTQPGNNWWQCLLVILFIGAVGAGAYLLYRRKKK